MNKEEMKLYTGTKTVKAMPMTMGEAYVLLPIIQAFAECKKMNLV